MKKHGLHVKMVCEFFPKNAALLGMNVNRGAKVYLRLRQHYDETRFLPFESVVGTMLHELTHNRHGPHDQSFYAYLDKITLDLEQMMAAGWQGDGFYSQGHVLGTGSMSNALATRAQMAGGSLVSADVKRKAAILAARRRELFSNSGSKLGTLSDASPTASSSQRISSPRNLRDAVRAAAERRQEDSKRCKHMVGNPASLSTEELGIEVIDLTDSDVEERQSSSSHSAQASPIPYSKPAKPQTMAKTIEIIDLTDD